jgi:hypothetical protein
MKVGIDDYFAAGHTAEEFFNLVLNTPPAAGSYEAPTDFGTLMKRHYPTTEYMWGDFVVKGEVNLLFGDGGVGKSLLALHVAMAVAGGTALFGNPTLPMPVIGLFAEDGEGEVQRRLLQIYHDFELPANTDLPIKLWCRPREETMLAIIDDNGIVTEQPRLQMLRTELEKSGPALVILDSLADLFALNESLRLPVNAAMKRVLGSLCRDFGATVIVLAHPSKASMMDGSHYSGSTAFNNAVRQRLTLEISRNDALPDGPPPRRLSVAKSNYGPLVEKELWFYGATIQAQPRGPTVSVDEEKRKVLQTVLDLIDHGVRIVNRNGSVGGARTLNDLAKTIREQHGMGMTSPRVKDHLRQFVDAGNLTYREADKSVRPHVTASFVRGPQCKI